MADTGPFWVADHQEQAPEASRHIAGIVALASEAWDFWHGCAHHQGGEHKVQLVEPPVGP